MAEPRKEKGRFDTKCRTPAPCTGKNPCGARDWSGVHPYTASPDCTQKDHHHHGLWCPACNGWA